MKIEAREKEIGSSGSIRESKVTDRRSSQGEQQSRITEMSQS